MANSQFLFSINLIYVVVALLFTCMTQYFLDNHKGVNKIIDFAVSMSMKIT